MNQNEPEFNYKQWKKDTMTKEEREKYDIIKKLKLRCCECNKLFDPDVDEECFIPLKYLTSDVKIMCIDCSGKDCNDREENQNS